MQTHARKIELRFYPLMPQGVEHKTVIDLYVSSPQAIDVARRCIGSSA